jgi:uroporphyrinogen-III synthase
VTTLGPVLAGARVLLTAQRRAGDFAVALERRGADVVVAPSLGMESHIDEPTLLEQTRRIIDLHADVVVVTTGIGFRGWLETAEVAGLGPELLSALEETRLIARGPKARGALQAAGLVPDWVAESETSAEVASHLLDVGVDGLTIAVQHHGAGDDGLERRLSGAGATTAGLVVYRWGSPPDPAALATSIRDAAEGRFDAVAFTSAPGAAAWIAAADDAEVCDDLRRLAKDGRLSLLAVGPVTADPLRVAGFEPLIPERSRLGALVRLMVTHLGAETPTVRTTVGELRVRATAATLDHHEMSLSPGSLAILRELAREPGRVRSREQLLTVMPGESDDPHAAEVAVARLRDIVGRDVVRTVVKRGYALAMAAS